ncbi:cell wall-associated NlpC family hydrolase [Paenibacillus baekrokdamisoli]|uniref:NlpC/P60 family protein n=1 Tax=Paenibacillus baekrokdamisoli TaxID=1712516 RepID=UPI0018410FAA|nr:NlpC/P60 family protein [Paenibacillus baekrokdamisoli]MBB3071629.1 cell wall-associated NlpC family hydrolase [Paenibacillus baekrokdamisoli]
MVLSLMFFTNYAGTKASSYANINKDKAVISHVGIYLGNGQVLHTYSTESGGVRTNDITGTHWEYRFLFGGSAL